MFYVLILCVNFDDSGSNHLTNRSESPGKLTFNSEITALKEVFNREYVSGRSLKLENLDMSKSFFIKNLVYWLDIP